MEQIISIFEGFVKIKLNAKQISLQIVGNKKAFFSLLLIVKHIRRSIQTTPYFFQ
jgi:hypothetical protein